MVTVDAKGLSCPEPVMLAKKAVKKNPSDDVQIVVDDATARDNILRMARSIKRTTDVRDIDGVYTITLKA